MVPLFLKTSGEADTERVTAKNQELVGNIEEVVSQKPISLYFSGKPDTERVTDTRELEE